MDPNRPPQQRMAPHPWACGSLPPQTQNRVPPRVAPQLNSNPGNGYGNLQLNPDAPVEGSGPHPTATGIRFGRSEVQNGLLVHFADVITPGERVQSFNVPPPPAAQQARIIGGAGVQGGTDRPPTIPVATWDWETQRVVQFPNSDTINYSAGRGQNPAAWSRQQQRQQEPR